MNVAAWIVAGVLALAYLVSGLMKVGLSHEQLAKNPNLAWVQDMSAGAVKAIGAAEVLGAIGVIVPEATNIAPVLTPLAAAGLAVIQIGAAVVHLRRNEAKALPINIVLFALAAFLAIVRFTG